MIYLTSQPLLYYLSLVKREAGRLQSEIRQARPFPSRQAEALLGLLRTTDVVRRQVAAVVGAEDVTFQQYNVLRILLVRRKRCPADRRQVLCWITPAGLELLARLDAPVAASDQSTLGGLTPDRIDLLIELLDDLRGHLLARDEAAAPPAGPRPERIPKEEESQES
jgi:hypothetical protein